ncbi:MAG TPA: hypothetical protein VNN79_14710, partial [Actinomycetota bacterium]|nr:hypothetical protein [Actinomycetota bacterium]
MPEQASRRGEPQLEASLTQPLATPIYPFGNGGLDLNSAIDKVKVGEFTRLSNAYYTIGESQELTGRPGQTELATAGTTHHSILRVDDPLTGDFTRMWGVDTSLYLGKTGALASIDAGYSGNPLTLLPHRPPLSGEPWVFVGDSARIRKVRSDGLVTEIGLPAPSVAAMAALGPAQTTGIATFSTADGTGPTVWTPNAGTDFSSDPLPTDPPPQPTAAFTGGVRFSGFAGNFLVYLGMTGWYQFFGLAMTRNLSKVGSRDATDDDLIHLKIMFDKPANIAEVRIYFVVSTPFSPSILPGAQTDVLTPNTDYYVKAFRPGDFSQFIFGIQPEVVAAETARVNYIREQSLIAS